MGKSRVRQLDGLRGVAITLVVAAHLAPGLLDAGGPLGVLLFFVLSSYLITTLLLREHDATGRLELPRFYLRRALRLVPALVVTLALYLGVVAVVPGVQADHGGARLGAATGVLYVANFAQAFHWGMPSELVPLWSLSVEEQFYLTWPALLWVVLSRRGLVSLHNQLRRVLPFLALGSVLYPFLALWTDADLYFLPVAWLTPLCCGALLAVSAQARAAGHTVPWLDRLSVAPVAAAAAGVLAASIVYEQLPFQALKVLLLLPLQSVAAAILLAGLISHRLHRSVKVLSSRPLTYLGALSYGLYLVHNPVIVLSQRVLGHSFEVRAASVAGAVVLAVLLHRVIERPFLALKSKLAEPPAARVATSNLLGAA